MVVNPATLLQFELNPPATRTSYDRPPNWFKTTDGQFAINLPCGSVYEYQELNENCNPQPLCYDYYIARFVSDFSEVLQTIGIQIPNSLEIHLRDISAFRDFKRRALAFADSGTAPWETEEKLLSWIYKRAVTTEYLVEGPTIWFFRVDKRMRIIWDSNCQSNNSLWAYPCGVCDTNFSFFVSELEKFNRNFFAALSSILFDLSDLTQCERLNLLLTNSQQQQLFSECINEIHRPAPFSWSPT